MNRRFSPGSAPTGLTLMYAAMCLMVIVQAVLITLPLFPTTYGLRTGRDIFDAIQKCLFGFGASKLLFVFGGALCVGLAKQSGLGFMHYIALVIWTLSAGVDFFFGSSLENLVKAPQWLEPIRFALGLIAIACSLFFFRNLANETGSEELIRRSRNTLQIGIFMIVFWVAFAAIPHIDLRLALEFSMYFSLGLLLGTLIAFIMYAKLLLATKSELTSVRTPTTMDA
jgi:hypothetical protein